MSAITRLLATPEGMEALKLLVPAGEKLADYLAGRRDDTDDLLAQVPSVDAADLALARARVRAAQP